MFGLSTTTVALIEVCVAVPQTLVLLIAGGVAWRQLHEAQRTRYLGAIIRMYDDIGSRAAYEDADAALGLPDRIEDYTPEERELATWTTRVYRATGLPRRIGDDSGEIHRPAGFAAHRLDVGRPPALHPGAATPAR